MRATSRNLHLVSVPDYSRTAHGGIFRRARIVWYRDYNLHSQWLLHTLIAVMRKSDNAPNFSVERLLISSMSADLDHELEVSLTPFIATNNSH